MNKKVTLSKEHIAAINRDRQVIDNFDCLDAFFRMESVDINLVRKLLFELIDDPQTRLDSIWWNLGEGNTAIYPSKVIPTLKNEKPYDAWFKEGIDILKVLIDETRKRGLETFFSYRINGSDNDVADGESTKITKIPMKEAHPEWLIHTWKENFNVQHTTKDINGFWNFAFDGVRKHKLKILQEVCENYDLDGIEIDFARVCPVLPPGHQWENRDRLTEFMRSLRFTLLEIEKKRDKPLLIAARVPENLQGCHFDGIDVEIWAQEELVDIFVMGVRSFDVDIHAFQRICSDTNIKLYPCIDDNHATDGYQHPSIEVFRGVIANWLHQGADGIETFNWAYTSKFFGPDYLGNPPLNELLSLKSNDGTDDNSIPMRPDENGQMVPNNQFIVHQQVYRELNNLEEIHNNSKAFVVQRRGGGHGSSVAPNPEDWWTPRWMYMNTNMLALLPEKLACDGKADTLLTVYIADKIDNSTDSIKEITALVLLSDPTTDSFPKLDRLERVKIATMGHPNRELYNLPPNQNIKDNIELRINNSLLEKPLIDKGWLVYQVNEKQIATGENLIGLRMSKNTNDNGKDLIIEKFEIHINYK